MSHGLSHALDLEHLPGTSALRLFPVQPACDAPSAQRLQEALAKLFAQFAREGRVTASGSALLASGAVLAVAWQSAETLSGCSHDRLGRLLLHVEDGGRSILNAPPLVIETAASPAGGGLPALAAATVACCDRTGLRRLLAEGRISGASLLWDLRVATLQALLEDCRKPLADHPLGALVLTQQR